MKLNECNDNNNYDYTNNINNKPIYKTQTTNGFMRCAR